jgi:hypothetical protein
MVELWGETNFYSNVSVYLQFLMSDLTHYPSCENEEKDCTVRLAALVSSLVLPSSVLHIAGGCVFR